MTVKAFPPERANEPLHERLFLGGFRTCPVLGNARRGKIALRVLHVFAAAAVNDADLFSETGNRLFQRGFGVPAWGEQAMRAAASLL